MKKAVSLACICLCAVSFAENITLGSGALQNSVGCNGNIAIGTDALAGADSCDGNVIIGSRELVNVAGLTDTTSINGQQIFASRQFNAFAINPNKESSITNTPLYLLNDELHLNARRIVFNGEATGLTKASVTKDAYSQMYIPNTVDLPLQNGYAERDGLSLLYLFKIWMTNIVSRLEYQMAFDSDTVVSARVVNVTCGHWWSREYPGGHETITEDDYCITNRFVIPVADDGKSFKKGATVSVVPEYPDVDRYYVSFSAVVSADGRSASIRIYDGGGIAPYQGDDMMSHSITFPDVHEARRELVPTSPVADDRPIQGNVTNLITSAAVAENCVLNESLGLERVDGYQFVSIYPQQAHVDEQTGKSDLLIYRIDVGITEEAARQIVETQEPDAQGYYTATGFTHMRAFGVRTFHDDTYGEYYSPSTWRTDEVNALFVGENDYTEVIIQPHSTKFYVTFDTNDRTTGNTIWSEVFEIPFPTVKFKATSGMMHKADATVSKSCLSTTKYVDNRLGGLSLKNEDGAISVYSGGVKIGTLTLNPTP